MLIAALIVTPILWIGLARWAGIPLGTVSDLGGLLATIGGAMGAIFAIGGLVIALVSVYTQLSIEDRVQRTFDQLQPALDERASKQIEANIAFLRATGEREWRTAQQLTREAIEKWPALRGARSFLAGRMADDVVDWFFRRQLGTPPPSGPSRASSPLGPLSTPAGYVVSTLPMALPSPLPPARIVPYPHEEPPLVEAIRWLEDAIAHEEDTDGELRARLALMYGVYGRQHEMIEAVRKALLVKPDLKPYFSSSDQLPMLVYPCRTAPDLRAALEPIARTLDLTLPVPATQVAQAVEAVRTTQLISGQNAFWIAFKKPGPGSTTQVASSLNSPRSISWSRVGRPAQLASPIG